MGGPAQPSGKNKVSISCQVDPSAFLELSPADLVRICVLKYINIHDHEQ